MTTLEDALDLVKTQTDDSILAVNFTKRLVALEAFVESLSAKAIQFQESVSAVARSGTDGTLQRGDLQITMGKLPRKRGMDETLYNTKNGKWHDRPTTNGWAFKLCTDINSACRRRWRRKRGKYLTNARR